MFGSICGSSLLLFSWSRRSVVGVCIPARTFSLCTSCCSTLSFAASLTRLSMTMTYRGMRGTQVDIDCHAFLYFHMSAIYAENWANLVLAINRLFAIALPFLYKKITTTPGSGSFMFSIYL
ncbi:hypothetical protein BV898_08530 [Hypsibius exemplaris]|uniref:Uncharacterized protein n=1 Tax=Hypsibius exemplaris TaxID=2072580 RepID=A0A1W0WQJ5_HYPEX|nr:hypothetical protein BV898_08530 [Hypsibius exemplaris]